MHACFLGKTFVGDMKKNFEGQNDDNSKSKNKNESSITLKCLGPNGEEVDENTVEKDLKEAMEDKDKLAAEETVKEPKENSGIEPEKEPNKEAEKDNNQNVEDKNNIEPKLGACILTEENVKKLETIEKGQKDNGNNIFEDFL